MEGKLCYICSPYRGDTERNAKYAAALTRAAIVKGYTPITPHLYITQALDDRNLEERALGMEATPVVPLPANGSSTIPPGGLPASTHGSTSFSGNVAKCAPLNPAVATLHTSRLFRYGFGL